MEKDEETNKTFENSKSDRNLNEHLNEHPSKHDKSSKSRSNSDNKVDLDSEKDENNVFELNNLKNSINLKLSEVGRRTSSVLCMSSPTVYQEDGFDENGGDQVTVVRINENGGGNGGNGGNGKNGENNSENDGDNSSETTSDDENNENDGKSSFFEKILNESSITITVARTATAEELFKICIQNLNLTDPEYFGIYYLDRSGQRIWLVHNKPIADQLGFLKFRNWNFHSAFKI